VSGYTISNRARADLKGIWEYIAENSNEETADRVFTELYDAFDLLCSNPRMGHYRLPDLTKEFRVWPVYSYLVIYRPESHPLEIVRVWHGAQEKPEVS